MAHLVPSYTSDPFVRVTPASGDSEAFPRDVMTDAQIREAYGEDVEIENITGKVWGRLSAPGYLDCTVWDGPFDTIDEAKASIRETYEVDPETGAALDEDD